MSLDEQALIDYVTRQRWYGAKSRTVLHARVLDSVVLRTAEPQFAVALVELGYSIADAERFGLRLTPDEGSDITRITEMIKAAAAEQLPVVHPDQPGFAGITIGQLSGPAHDPGNSWRNAVTVSTGKLDWSKPGTWTGAIDRSPCGTGTCAKMATLHAKGRLPLHQDFIEAESRPDPVANHK